jgi:SPP1 gp7 family putative phage head morphogenesis protein
LHISILAASARGHRKRHGNARPQRRLRSILRNHRAELNYRAALLQLVRRCQGIVNANLDQLRVVWAQRPTIGDGVRVGDNVPSSAIRDVLAGKAKLGNLDTWSKRMVGLAVEANRDSVDKRLAGAIRDAIGVDVSHILRSNGGLLQSMQKATKENVALIKTIPEKYFDRVTETVTNGWSSGMRWETLVEQIQRDGDITENRAKLIARDQTAKMNSAFNQERQQQVGIEKYEWSTSEDERVRDSHADMDGEECSWDKPPMVDGEAVHPGEAINCRCVAIPVVDMDALEFQATQAEEAA